MSLTTDQKNAVKLGAKTIFGESTTEDAFSSLVDEVANSGPNYGAPAGTASGVNAYAAGSGSVASGDASFAIGYQARATQTYATALGAYCTASGAGSLSAGEYCTASAPNATALGYYSVASGYYSVAIGQSCTASATGAMATGIGASATQAGEIARAVSLSGFGTHREFVVARDLAATSGHLLDPAGNDITLSGYSAIIAEVWIVVGNAGRTKVATERHMLSISVGSGSATINDQTQLYQPTGARMSTFSWTLTIGVSGQTLTINLDPGSDTVKAVAYVKWHEVGGLQ